MVQYYEISFSYTLKCNALCDHCCIASSPQKKQKLKVEDVKKYLRASKKYGVKYAAFTGGEVTLYVEELLDILSYSKKLGIMNILVTNAHWARGIQDANCFVGLLKERGVVEIQISTDMFHLKYIPFNNVIYAIEASRRNQIKPIVMLARVKNDRKTLALKKKLIELDVDIVEQPVVPFSGRSCKIHRKRLHTISLLQMKHIGCISVLSPTISPSNKIYACCASDFSFSKKSLLYLGDLKKISLYEVLRIQQNNKILDALYLWGPKYLFDLVRKQKPNLVEAFPKVYHRYCHLCYMLLKNFKIVKFLKREFNDPALLRRIEIAKMIKYQKIKEMRNKKNPWHETVIEREQS